MMIARRLRASSLLSSSSSSSRRNAAAARKNADVLLGTNEFIAVNPRVNFRPTEGGKSGGAWEEKFSSLAYYIESYQVTLENSGLDWAEIAVEMHVEAGKSGSSS